MTPNKCGAHGGALLTLQSCWSDSRISWCLGGWIKCHGNVALACSVSTADLHFTLQVTSLGARAQLVHVPAVVAALCSCGLLGQLICHSMEITLLFPAGCTRSSCIHQRFDALAIWSAELAIAVVFPSAVPHLARPRTFVTVTVTLMSCLSLIKLLSFKRMGATDERLRTLQGARPLKKVSSWLASCRVETQTHQQRWVRAGDSSPAILSACVYVPGYST